MDITKQSWREKPYTIQSGKVLEIPFIDSRPNYCIVMNKSSTQLFVSRYVRCSTKDYDFTVPPNANRQWCWADSFHSLYILNYSGEPIDIILTTYSAAFTPVSVAQTGNNVVIGNDINISSMPGVTIANTPSVNIANVILNKPIPNQAIYFSVPLEFLSDNEIIAPDVTKNILELHVDIRNDGTSGSQRVPQTMGRQINGRHLANPTVGFGTSVREDLSFGPSGVGLDYGIYASCDIVNKIWIEGYAIVNSKS